jgi:hypothetical protein
MTDLYDVINQTITQTVAVVTSISVISFILPLLSSLVGAGVGAYLGHRSAIQRDERKDMGIRSGILEAFKTEIDTAFKKLDWKPLGKTPGQHVRIGEMVSTTIYDFMGGAGFMRLCKSDEITAICNAYSAIRNYNYEAIRSRDLKIQHDSAPSSQREQIWQLLEGSKNERDKLADSCMNSLMEVQSKFHFPQYDRVLVARASQ